MRETCEVADATVDEARLRSAFSDVASRVRLVLLDVSAEVRKVVIDANSEFSAGRLEVSDVPESVKDVSRLDVCTLLVDALLVWLDADCAMSVAVLFADETRFIMSAMLEAT
jgi:hypothetical protein